MKYIITSKMITFFPEKSGQRPIQISSANPMFKDVLTNRDSFSREELENFLNTEGCFVKLDDLKLNLIDGRLMLSNVEGFGVSFTNYILKKTEGLIWSERLEYMKPIIEFMNKNKPYYENVLEYIIDNNDADDIFFSDDGDIYIYRYYNNIDFLRLKKFNEPEVLVKIKNKDYLHKVYCRINFAPWLASKEVDVAIEPLFEDVSFFANKYGSNFDEDAYNDYLEKVFNFIEMTDNGIKLNNKDLLSNIVCTDYFNLLS